MGTEQAKPLSGGETLLFSLLPPPFGAIDPTFVCKIFEIFENILEPQPCSACVCKIFVIYEIFEKVLEPSALRLCAKYLKYSRIRINPTPRVSAKRWLCLPPHRLELVAWINGGRPTTSADETGFRIFEEFENIWKYLEYLYEQQGATSADETSPIRRNAC